MPTQLFRHFPRFGQAGTANHRQNVSRERWSRRKGLKIVQARDVCMTMRADMITHIDFPFTAGTKFDMGHRNRRRAGGIPSPFCRGRRGFLRGFDRGSDPIFGRRLRIAENRHDRAVGNRGLVQYRNTDGRFTDRTFSRFSRIGFLCGQMMPVGTFELYRHGDSPTLKYAERKFRQTSAAHDEKVLIKGGWPNRIGRRRPCKAKRRQRNDDNGTKVEIFDYNDSVYYIILSWRRKENRFFHGIFRKYLKKNCFFETVATIFTKKPCFEPDF